MLFTHHLRKRNMQPTALYRYFDAEGRLLYVGISLQPFTRAAQHRDNKAWYIEAIRIEIEWFGTRGDAEQAEWEAIRHEKPMHNRAFAKRSPTPIEQFVVLTGAGHIVSPITNQPVDEARNVPAIIAAKRRQRTQHQPTVEPVSPQSIAIAKMVNIEARRLTSLY